MNKTCPRCKAPFDPGTDVHGMCPRCAYDAALGPDEGLEARNQAEALIRGLKGMDDLEFIGQGGMGVLYRARQKELSRTVAIKVISADLAANPEYHARFQREAQALAALDHPQIVTIHDYGIADEIPYFVMEYVDGVSIRARLQERPLPPREALRIVLGIAQALDYAHRQGVVHRDIKPENILLRKDGRIKVADFGIARVLGQGVPATRLTASNVVVGTPAYLAPEQLENPDAADHRVDIYALGVLAYEMLTGHVPKGTCPPPSRLADVDDQVDDLVLRAMHPDPARRFADMAEMADALRVLVDPGSAGPRSAPPQLGFRRRIRRLAGSRLFWVLLTGAAFEVLFLASGASIEVQRDPRPLFDRFVASDSWVDQERILKTLRDEKMPDALNALLKAEAAGGDPRRAASALHIAHQLGRLHIISPEARIKALLAWGEGIEFHGGLKMFDDMNKSDSRDSAILVAMEEAGPSLGSKLFSDLIAGRIPCVAEERSGTISTSSASEGERSWDYSYRVHARYRAIAVGLGRVADPDLVRRMRDYALDKPDKKYLPSILLALATRLDLPHVGFDDDFPEELQRIYLRHMPQLLDDETAEAKWSQAVVLANEIFQWEGRQAQSGGSPTTIHANWLMEVGAGKAGASGSPLEQVAAQIKDLSWPLDDRAADALGRDLKKFDVKQPYLKALVLRWRRTGRYTLPYFPYPRHPYSRWGLGALRFSKRTSREARKILEPQPGTDHMPWEVHALFIRSIAGLPVHLGSASGTGKVDASISADVPPTGKEVTVHLGPTAVVPSKRAGSPGTRSLSVKGQFTRDASGRVRFGGESSSSFGGGWGSGTAGGSSHPGEAMVLSLGLTGSRSGDLRYGSFVVMLPEPPSVGTPETRWKHGLVRSLKRIADKPSLGRWRSDSEKPVTLAAWIPIPEAADPLGILWSRRGEFADESTSYLEDAKLGDLVGAALLMTGDRTPLQDAGLVGRLPRDLALRIYLFSPDEEVRRAVRDRASGPETRLDAEVIADILEKRGETDSVLAGQAGSIRSEGRMKMFLFVLPYLLGALVALLFGWLPFRRQHVASLACALVYTGLVSTFLTLEAGGRIWMPMIGHVLFVVAAFLYGGRGIRVLATALLAGGILQLMMPSSTVVMFGSGLLLCVYVAAVSLDLLVRWLPSRLPAWDAVTLLATWWLFVIPMGLTSGLSFLFMLRYEQFSCSLYTLTGGWAVLYLAGMMIAPLGLMRRARMRLLAGRGA